MASFDPFAQGLADAEPQSFDPFASGAAELEQPFDPFAGGNALDAADFKDAQIASISERYGDNVAADFQGAFEADPSTLTPEEFRTQWISDEKAEEAKGFLDKTIDFAGDVGEFGSNAFSGLKTLGGALVDVSMAVPRRVLGRAQIALNPSKEGLQSIVDEEKKFAATAFEAISRNALDLDQFARNAVGEAVDLAFRNKDEENRC